MPQLPHQLLHSFPYPAENSKTLDRESGAEAEAPEDGHGALRALGGYLVGLVTAFPQMMSTGMKGRPLELYKR